MYTSTAIKEGIKIEIFEISTAFCPVRSFLDYEKAVGTLKPKNAAFRLPKSGDAITTNRFNKTLKTMFSPFLKYGKVSGHSFRAGISSLLGKAGFPDADIQCLGRWNSDAYLKYIKLGRLRRIRNADRIGEFVEGQVASLT